jgi:hypothetical protein
VTAGLVPRQPRRHLVQRALSVNGLTATLTSTHNVFSHVRATVVDGWSYG